MPKSVMLVDDSAPFRKLVMRTLQQGALSIGRFEEASNGQEALEKLDADPVDIVLCDINMPKMSGQDLVKKIRETDAYKGVKIIMVSSESSQETIEALKADGADGYITKPFTPEEIQTALRSLFKIIEL